MLEIHLPHRIAAGRDWRCAEGVSALADGLGKGSVLALAALTSKRPRAEPTGAEARCHAWYGSPSSRATPLRRVFLLLAFRSLLPNGNLRFYSARTPGW